MKFTQSIIAAATLYSLTYAVNLESTSYTFDEDQIEFVYWFDESGSKGIKGAYKACVSEKPTESFCNRFKQDLSAFEILERNIYYDQRRKREADERIERASSLVSLYLEEYESYRRNVK